MKRLWSEFVAFIRFGRFYLSIGRFKRQGELDEARRLALKCVGLLDGQAVAISGAVVGFIPPLLAELSDATGRWEGEADAMRLVLASCSKIDRTTAKSFVLEPLKWMEKRLAWLERRLPDADGQRLVH